jgi:hypothetical protein
MPGKPRSLAGTISLMRSGCPSFFMITSPGIQGVNSFFTAVLRLTLALLLFSSRIWKKSVYLLKQI